MLKFCLLKRIIFLRKPQICFVFCCIMTTNSQGKTCVQNYHRNSSKYEIQLFDLVNLASNSELVKIYLVQ